MHKKSWEILSKHLARGQEISSKLLARGWEISSKLLVRRPTMNIQYNIGSKKFVMRWQIWRRGGSWMSFYDW